MFWPLNVHFTWLVVKLHLVLNIFLSDIENPQLFTKIYSYTNQFNWNSNILGTLVFHLDLVLTVIRWRKGDKFPIHQLLACDVEHMTELLVNTHFDDDVSYLMYDFISMYIFPNSHKSKIRNKDVKFLTFS